jgi:aminomethyltransferase
MARTGYTGEDGVEIIVAADDTETLWDTLLQFGESLGLKPIGLGARDTLRLEAAYPLHGHDIDEHISPLEAGLGWSVKLTKPVDFMGKSALLAQQAQPPRTTYCLQLAPGAIPRQHDVVMVAWPSRGRGDQWVNLAGAGVPHCDGVGSVNSGFSAGQCGGGANS